ncbi:MAG: hypothetical protein ETSY1_21465 [Candidatus Entotheonella factor]|uniref:Uncharacterized protein n=1 Tax=Entotheonella factor TaxID=1429438 RepID=W4LI20_ENTF1|nr:MAG: hypothetical protein ETSY1_21465 [Candidatus Entotheonella factor]
MQSSRQDLNIYVDAEAFNVVFDSLFHQHPEWFGFRSKIGDIEVTKPPTITFYSDRTPPAGSRKEDPRYISLSPGDGPRNVSVAADAKLTFLTTTMYIRIVVYARICVRNGILGVYDFLVRSHTGSRMLNSLFNLTIGPMLMYIESMVDTIALPMLHAIFGADLRVRPVDAFVVDAGQGSALGIVLGSHPSGVHHGLRPLFAGHQLNTGGRGVGTMVAIVPEETVNDLIERIASDFQLRINRKRQVLAFNIQIKGRIIVKYIRLRLRGEVSTVKAKVRFRRFRFGAGLIAAKPWIPLRGIRGAKADLHAALTVTADGRRAVFVLVDVEDVKVDLSPLLDLLTLPLSVFEGIFQDQLDRFNRRFTNHIIGSRDIELFQLPDRIPGTHLAVNMRFQEPGGLAFHHGFLSTTVHMSAEPPIDYSKESPSHAVGLTSIADTYVEGHNYVDEGKGKPIVFVPGYSLNRKYWDRQVE